MRKFVCTAECVSEGHPDKVADVISDSILDACLEEDPKSRVACETLVKNNNVILAGEITTKAHVDYEQIVKNAVGRCGYRGEGINGFGSSTCNILNLLSEQSPEIANAVGIDNEGSGDQGIENGYATDETLTYMPLPSFLSRSLINFIRQSKASGALKDICYPDAKTQVSVEYAEYKDIVVPISIKNVVVSTHHSPAILLRDLRRLFEDIVLKEWFLSLPLNIQRLFDENTIYYVNPAGSWTFGGPAADCGATSRKIVVDAYGPNVSVGGGGWAGKCSSKTDRTGAYMTRYLAKNIVSHGFCKSAFVQVSYIIGRKDPSSFAVDMKGITELGVKHYDQIMDLDKHISLCPADIIKLFDLQRPIYADTSLYGHFGRASLPWEQDWPKAFMRSLTINK